VGFLWHDFMGVFHGVIGSFKVDFFFLEGGFRLWVVGLVGFGGLGSGHLRVYSLMGLDDVFDMFSYPVFCFCDFGDVRAWFSYFFDCFADLRLDFECFFGVDRFAVATMAH